MQLAILFLSDKLDPCIMEKFNSILYAKKTGVEVFFVYHQQNNNIINGIDNYHLFSSDILYNLGYKPISESLVPGNNHFPLLDFYLKNKKYDYYWMIEDDVEFTGRWEVLFDTFNLFPMDFISTYIETYNESPYWYWWNSLNSGAEQVPIAKYIRSFNPVYRLSNRALSCIHKALSSGWSGHHEVLIPTLLNYFGFSIADMGGNSLFTIHGLENKFYDVNTLSHLPLKDIKFRSNTIFHPIKEKKRALKENLQKFCIISAVGKNSLHREWIKQKEKINFDLHLIVYDNSYNQFYNDVDFICSQNGYKMRLVYRYLKKHPEYLEHYEYFFIPDDDIITDVDNIIQLFQYMKQYALEIAQPGLTDSYYTYEHTLRDKLCLLRYTNFIEIMALCFSRNALNKVLHTFDANDSGWGIENHWPILISSTQKDIAILDQIKMIHTRPVQSYSNKNIRELLDYVRKYNLDRTIFEYEVIPIKEIILKKRGFFITNRKKYQDLNLLGEWIAKQLISLIDDYKISELGLTGIAGMALFLATYSRVSEKRKYLDFALTFIDRGNEFVGIIKEDLNFKTGIIGYCWVIEYLAHYGFIDYNTIDVMDEASDYIDENVAKQINLLSQEQLLGLKQYYAIRMRSPYFSPESLLYQREKKILANIDVLVGDRLNISDKIEEVGDFFKKHILNVLDSFMQTHSMTSAITEDNYNDWLRMGWIIVALLSNEETELGYCIVS